MKFFIPGTKDGDQAEKIYESVRKYNERESRRPITPRRIGSMSFRHDGYNNNVVVGEIYERSGELVIAILEGDKGEMYYVCTPTRGIRRDGPHLVGKEEVLAIVDFETTPR